MARKDKHENIDAGDNAGANGAEQSNSAEKDFSAALAALPAIVKDIHGVSVSLPRMNVAGMPHTELSALTADTFNARQFVNNMVAGAKAREEAYAKAENDEDRAKYAPWTADDYLAKWAKYEYTGGGTVKVSAMEQMRYDAAWSAYVGLVTAHNAAVAAGREPVIVKRGAKPIIIAEKPRKDKKTSQEDHDAAIASWQTGRDNVVARMRENPEYADMVQKELDRIMAEAGTAKAAAAVKAEEVVADGSDLL